MNERIKELMEQAEDPEHGFVIPELFAQLIVKECVGIVENLSPGYQDYRNQIEDAFRNDCITEIKYHFGVEE
jgi:hypothetical protein